MQKEIIVFFDKIKEVLKEELPFVVYRKPTEKKVTLIIQKSTKLVVFDDFTESGFVFSPFDSTKKGIILPADESEKYSIIINDDSLLKSPSNQSEIEQTANIEETKKQHILLVEKSIDFIKNNKADKIVVSRCESLEVDNFKVLNSYKKMLCNYPNAMVYLWSHPKVGCWMGASPERLIHINNGIFKTMALAGTQSYNNTIEVAWKSKEKKEQQFVTDYILETIKSSVNNVEVFKPYTVKAGNLLHIRTDIIGNLKDNNSIKLLIDSLHPTPAVCGLPKNIATDFICDFENYNREFYTGYLGELNVGDETNLFVNLRCMQIVNNIVSIYVGGGITKDSIAEKEWQETVFKAEVMKKVL